MTDGWLLIAEFARRCRLPVSTLRYYDRVGLLRPARVDPHSGYRWYRRDQIADAVVVASLRAGGAAPEVIGRVLAGGAGATAALASERARLTGEIRRHTAALARLDRLYPAAPGTPRRVRLTPVTVPARTVTCDARDPARVASALRRGVACLRGDLRRRGTAVAAFGALLPLDPAEQLVAQVFARAGDPSVVPGADAVDLPGGEALQVVHEGAPDTLAHAYDRLLHAVEEAGDEPAGPVVETYTADTTEVAVPVTPRG